MLQGKGPAVCIGEDIDTDLIIAGRYLRTKDRQIWAEHVFEDLDSTLHTRLNGSVLIAGKNMGCGSSREQAVVALKLAGVKVVIAPTFARIFFRNCINVGLPVMECDSIQCHEGEMVNYDCNAGKVEIGGVLYSCGQLSSRMQEILSEGGLVEFWKRRLQR